MKHFLLALTIFCLTDICVAQKTEKKLEEKILNLIKGFNGDVGIYIRA